MDYQTTAAYLKLMAHPVRLQILDMLRGGEVCVCHIETALHKRQAYISQQLMILREAEAVQSRKEGLQVYYRLADPALAELVATVCGTTPLVLTLAACPCPSCAVETERS